MSRQRRRTTFTAALLLAAGLAVSGGVPAGAATPSAPAAPTVPTVAAEGIPVGLTMTELVAMPRSLVAYVDPLSPESGRPTGEVTFAVDSQPVATEQLVDGVARARVMVLPGATREITATYGGAEGFTPSSDSYTRTDPTAEVSVEGTRRNGWYNTPVVVTTTCEPGSGEIISCTPERVVQQSTPDRILLGVARADDGGEGRDSTSFRVDLVDPTLGISGGGPGPFPRDARPLGCRARDDLSGIDGRCRISYGKVTRGEDGPVRPWRVSVRDVAGNTVVRRGALRIAR